MFLAKQVARTHIKRQARVFQRYKKYVWLGFSFKTQSMIEFLQPFNGGQ